MKKKSCNFMRTFQFFMKKQSSSGLWITTLRGSVHAGTSLDQNQSEPGLPAVRYGGGGVMIQTQQHEKHGPGLFQCKFRPELDWKEERSRTAPEPETLMKFSCCWRRPRSCWSFSCCRCLSWLFIFHQQVSQLHLSDTDVTTSGNVVWTLVSRNL